jgi:hypothetical protein
MLRESGLCFIPVATLLVCAVPALAQSPYPFTRPEVKCERYTKAWTQALARKGTKGLGEEFLKSHAAFLASGCTARADVCPRSAQELEMANTLVLMAMSEGMASTFLPFACRK